MKVGPPVPCCSFSWSACFYVAAYSHLTHLAPMMSVAEAFHFCSHYSPKAEMSHGSIAFVHLWTGLLGAY